MSSHPMLRVFRKAEAELESGLISREDFLAVVDDVLECTGSEVAVEKFKAAAARPVFMYKRASLRWLRSLKRIAPADWAREDADRWALLCRARAMAADPKLEDGQPHVHCYVANGRAFVVVEWLARGGRIAVRVLSHEELPTKGAAHDRY